MIISLEIVSAKGYSRLCY